MKLIMEQWKKFLTESSDWKDENYTDPMLASSLAARLARKIVDEAGDNWSWLEDDLEGEASDLKYVMEIGIQPEDSETFKLLKLDPFDYFTKNYVDLEEEVIDRKRAAEAAGIEDEWIISFKRTLEELAEWIEGLIKELFKDL
jgi:hypothetical protein